MKNLVVEYKKGFEPDKNCIYTGRGVIMFTPSINEDYWIMRVVLYKDQAIVAFPKFGLIGVGFAQESDWNTNLPYQCSTEKLYEHIKRNKKYRAITKQTCLEAIKLLQEACKNYEEVKAQKEPIKVNVNDINCMFDAIGDLSDLKKKVSYKRN
jgi:hypothetical protein